MQRPDRCGVTQGSLRGLPALSPRTEHGPSRVSWADFIPSYAAESPEKTYVLVILNIFVLFSFFKKSTSILPIVESPHYTNNMKNVKNIKLNRARNP